ncbi:TauD/TfdA family dioxygenase [Burkholderia pseudomallei]|uniref:TauD/TfdA family dioxygenase n=1 Tax=Burkholderia pseudomallei TaxID=28450 RepID=UPI00050E95C9|nr:TauD/TfdA family dioxygenase [Burkholderia pseudomallei]KGD33644.1 taurine catabolism dioxygenase TauD, TfdA family protein [Burkholderia pseudomallei]
MTALLTLSTALAKRGWAHHRVGVTEADDVVSELDRIGNLLGTRIRGRAGALEEIVCPQTSEDAHPRSLSARYGLNALPFHTELSHRPRPCRYILLGCMEPGSPSAVTMLLDWRTLGFSPEELHLLESAPILVRTGRHSFYSTTLSSDRTLLRYDPGCLEAIDERGRTALRLVEHRLASGSAEIHRWHRGDILIIDNWRVLHGRGPSRHGSGRRLARILIDG